jgi:hypothetical protein
VLLPDIGRPIRPAAIDKSVGGKPALEATR